jgi:serine/threonine-protein kinase
MKLGSKNIDTILCDAVEIESIADRNAFLDAACGEDAELRGRVEKLVADHFRAGEFLESPAAATATAEFFAPSEGPGSVIGPYKLLEQIGEGGMGVVFTAEQAEPIQRKVALKIIKPGMDTRQVIDRVREAEGAEAGG